MPNAVPVFRVYRMAWWFRLFTLLFFISGSVLTGALLQKLITGVPLSKAADYFVPLIFLLAGFGMSSYAFATRVRFTQDAIEKCNLLGKKRLPLVAIRGRREYVVRGDVDGGSTRYLRLVSSDDRYPTVDLMKNGYNWDSTFQSWYASLNDLDGRDKEETGKTSNFGLV